MLKRGRGKLMASTIFPRGRSSSWTTHSLFLPNLPSSSSSSFFFLLQNTQAGINSTQNKMNKRMMALAVFALLCCSNGELEEGKA